MSIINISFLISYLRKQFLLSNIKTQKLRLDMNISFYINPYISAVEDEYYDDTTEFRFTELLVG